jgi:hypothetical protein
MNTQRYAPSVSGIGRPTTFRRVASLLGALFLAVVLIWSWAGSTSSAQAVAPYVVSQCSGDDNTGGLDIKCSVVVTNTLNVTDGSGTSTVVVEECHGAANAEPTCTTVTTEEGPIVTSVTQCNGSGNGGGGTVECSVSITNNIVGDSTTTPATVNQCIESGQGGGDLPLLCSPVQETSGATVTQCNGSVNGGGAPGRVLCTVTAASPTSTSSTTTSELPVSINQCNGSANGGGSFAICTASITNNVTPAAVVPSTPPSTTPSTPPSATPSTPPSTPSGTPSTPSTTPGGGGGEGGDTPTTPAVPVVPGTPSGSASPSTPGELAETGTNDAGGLFIGALSLLFAGALGVLAVNVHRHRRSLQNSTEL